MRWTWEQIDREWLEGNKIAVSPELAVAAFNRVDSLLGPEWMKGCRGSTGTASGTAPTLAVVSMGQRLAVIEGVQNTSPLVKRICRGDHSASAELTAIYLIRSGSPRIGVELEPEVSVAGRTKKPDFRFSLPGEPDTYVEVTQPNLSVGQKEVERALGLIGGAIKDIKKGFALEVFLRRVPTDAELESITAQLPAFCTRQGVDRKDLGDLGFLLLNQDSPGRIKLRSHKGEENHPRIGMAKVITGPNEPRRHVVVRLAFWDDRAQHFLKREAKQLPNDAPGLIMVQMGHAPGGFKTWEAILRNRLQLSLHTRVSAICLFHSGFERTADGEAWISRTRLILNPHAKRPLPDWISPQLSRYASEW